jgi:hypothetical protein
MTGKIVPKPRAADVGATIDKCLANGDRLLNDALCEREVIEKAAGERNKSNRTPSKYSIMDVTRESGRGH